ncbi:MAG TPA: VOC family protein [Gammaproteobacteria bacterium]
MTTGVNHITFAVSDLQRSLRFYVEVLGCAKVATWNQGAYLRAGETTVRRTAAAPRCSLSCGSMSLRYSSRSIVSVAAPSSSEPQRLFSQMYSCIL